MLGEGVSRCDDGCQRSGCNLADRVGKSRGVLLLLANPLVFCSLRSAKALVMKKKKRKEKKPSGSFCHRPINYCISPFQWCALLAQIIPCTDAETAPQQKQPKKWTTFKMSSRACVSEHFTARFIISPRFIAFVYISLRLSFCLRDPKPARFQQSGISFLCRSAKAREQTQEKHLVERERERQRERERVCEFGKDRTVSSVRS